MSPGDRWQRSMRFLRTLGESLRWKDDRMAMALFAHIAAPQVRLTKDPNTYFFFLDHLAHESPFRLEDDTTWDTNIELGIAWGMRLIEKDSELLRQVAERQGVRAGLRRPGVERRGGARRSRSRAPTTSRSSSSASARRSAAIIPEPERKPNDTSPREPPIRAVARSRVADRDRQRRRRRVPASSIAKAIARSPTASSTPRASRAGSRGLEVANEELYWRFLLAAAAFIAVGLLFLQERTELWLQAAGAAVALTMVWTLTR